MERFYGKTDLMKMLDVGEGKAYSLMREWNKELAAKGFTTVQGKVVKAYADIKLGLQIKTMEDICRE